MDDVERHSFTARVHPRLVDYATDIHLAIGLSLLDRRRDFEAASRYRCSRADRVMRKLRISEADEAVLEELFAATDLTKQQIVDVALHQAKLSPLAPLPDSAAKPVGNPFGQDHSDRSLSHQAGHDGSGGYREAGDIKYVSELPFFVAADGDLYPDFEVMTPFDAELLFLQASVSQLLEHQQQIYAVLTDSVTDDVEVELIEAARKILEDVLANKPDPEEAEQIPSR
ncbi:MAG: hypothetical protein RLW87_20345 [Alphaproteobacteria bacterium]